jgi:hypothetical protein
MRVSPAARASAVVAMPPIASEFNVGSPNAKGRPGRR